MEIPIIPVIAFILMLINISHSEKSIADQIKDILCKPGKKDDQWNRGMMCCQSINCYHLVSNIIFDPTHILEYSPKHILENFIQIFRSNIFLENFIECFLEYSIEILSRIFN